MLLHLLQLFFLLPSSCFFSSFLGYPYFCSSLFQKISLHPQNVPSSSSFPLPPGHLSSSPSPTLITLPTFIAYLHHLSSSFCLNHLPSSFTFIAYFHCLPLSPYLLHHLPWSLICIIYLHHLPSSFYLHCLPLSPTFIYHLPSSSLTFIIHLSSLICIIYLHHLPSLAPLCFRFLLFRRHWVADGKQKHRLPSAIDKPTITTSWFTTANYQLKQRLFIVISISFHRPKAKS